MGEPIISRERVRQILFQMPVGGGNATYSELLRHDDAQRDCIETLAAKCALLTATCQQVSSEVQFLLQKARALEEAHRGHVDLLRSRASEAERMHGAAVSSALERQYALEAALTRVAELERELTNQGGINA